MLPFVQWHGFALVVWCVPLKQLANPKIGSVLAGSVEEEDDEREPLRGGVPISEEERTMYCCETTGGGQKCGYPFGLGTRLGTFFVMHRVFGGCPAFLWLL